MEMERPLYGYQWGLVEKIGTAPKQSFTEISFFEISTSNLEHNFFGFLFFIL